MRLKDLEKNKCKYYTGTIHHSCEKYLKGSINGDCMYIRDDECKLKRFIRLKNLLIKIKNFLNNIYENSENETDIGQSYELILRIEQELESEVTNGK